MYPRVPLTGTVGTGDSVSGSLVRYSFLSPNDLWIQEIVNGMLSQFTSSAAFTQMGAVTTDQAAQVFSDLFASLNLSTNVGTIFPFAGLALPSYALPCVGDSVLRADYPELFAIIGVLWGNVDGTHFTLPDFRGRVLGAPGTYPAGSLAITDTTGEGAHTLTSSEMPAHTHSVEQFLPTAAGLEVTLASLDSGLPISSTGSTGGGGAHNNIQPTVIVQWGIVALGT